MKTGIAIYLAESENDKVRLVLDDIVSESTDAPEHWRKNFPYTHNDYDLEKLKTLSLSSDELALIGENLIVRLLALSKLI